MASMGSRDRGAALFLAMVMLVAALLAAVALQASTRSLREGQERQSERALAQAREALVAYATDHPINAAVGPGYLPCPDLDNDGWAESTCGSLSGDTGQEQRLGRLPWKTLGLPDLRDGYGERLWYAVSTKYKGLLNCAASRGCVDMSPAAALGTITVRDASGLVVQDAATAGAAAVILAAGPPIERAGVLQRRDCGPLECDANAVCLMSPPQRASLCDPRNYLDLAHGLTGGDEDNASFVDRQRDGFVQGPVTLAGVRVVNDRVAVVTYADLMPRMMRRVALEVADCLRFYASRPENAGRLPWAAETCADPASAMVGIAGNAEGRVADTPFDAAAASGLLPRWWRAQARTPELLAELPTQDDACRIALAPDDPGPARSWPPGAPAAEGTTAGTASVSWWNAWKPYVTLSVAPGFTPHDAPNATCGERPCIRVVDANGSVLAAAARAVVVVRRTPAACATAVSRCDATGCLAAIDPGDAFAWLP